MMRLTAARREQQTSDGSRPGQAFRGVTLIPDRFKKQTGTKLVETVPSSGGSGHGGMAQFETKVRALETAA